MTTKLRRSHTPEASSGTFALACDGKVLHVHDAEEQASGPRPTPAPEGPVQVYWSRSPSPGNFGDILNPWLVAAISKRSARWVPAATSGVHLCIGSILGNTRPSTVVWGTGVMDAKTKVDPRADYRAVRGPLSREAVIGTGGKCPEVYGDPALLLPRFFRPATKKKFALGIFPHYVDSAQVRKWTLPSDVLVLNPLTDRPLDLIADICRCERIVSSSLHGLIVSIAYGIPALWVEFSGRLCGDGTKFRDFLLSIGQSPYQPMRLRGKSLDIPKLCNATRRMPVDIDLDSLLVACPFAEAKR